MPLIPLMREGGALLRWDRGASGNAAEDRSGLVWGTYKPDATTTGVLDGVARGSLVVGGVLRLQTPGQILENVDLYNCTIKPEAPGIIIRNVWCHGRTPKASPGINDHYPLIDMTSSLANDTIIEDTTLIPDPANESVMAYGIKGGGFTCKRVHIARVVDGIQTWRDPVIMEASYVTDLTRFDPDVTRTAGDASHNDGMQLQGGSTTDIRGCNIDVTVTPWTSRSLTCIIATTNYAAHAWIKIRNTWAAGGSIPLNILGGAAAPTSGLQMTDNTITLGQENYGGGTPYAHAIIGTATQATMTNTGNVDTASGVGPIIVKNGG